jgi:hypothetical protein
MGFRDDSNFNIGIASSELFHKAKSIGIEIYKDSHTITL